MTTTTFSRKTIAIALAAGMTLGAVTVPQFAGVQGMSAVASAESGNVPANDYIELDFTPTTSSGLVRSVDSDNNLTAYFGQKGATYNYKIPAETLTKAGIDPTKEFIVNERSDALVSVTTWDGNSGRPHKITKNETLKVSAGEAPHGITLTGFSGDTNQGTFAEIKQGDALLRVGRDTPDVYFQPFNSTVVKPGSQVQTKPQRIFGVKDLTHFSIVNNVPGASVDQNTGRLTYTPPSKLFWRIR